MLAIAVLLQLIGLVVVFQHGSLGMLGVLIGILLIVAGGVLYRHELAKRRAR
jgi:hypothetical protein